MRSRSRGGVLMRRSWCLVGDRLPPRLAGQMLLTGVVVVVVTVAAVLIVKGLLT